MELYESRFIDKVEELEEEKEHELTEMPHLKLRGGLFDLEIEKFRNVGDFLNYISEIIDGHIKIDKYGNQISLNSKQEKQEFIMAIMKDKMFHNYVNIKLTPNERKLLDMILRI